MNEAKKLQGGRFAARQIRPLIRRQGLGAGKNRGNFRSKMLGKSKRERSKKTKVHHRACAGATKMRLAKVGKKYGSRFHRRESAWVLRLKEKMNGKKKKYREGLVWNSKGFVLS